MIIIIIFKVLDINIIIISHFVASALIANILVNSIVISIATIIHHRCYRQSRHFSHLRQTFRSSSSSSSSSGVGAHVKCEAGANPMRSLAFTTHQNAN
jgi:hypothetical protein